MTASPLNVTLTVVGSAAPTWIVNTTPNQWYEFSAETTGLDTKHTDIQRESWFAVTGTYTVSLLCIGPDGMKPNPAIKFSSTYGGGAFDPVSGRYWDACNGGHNDGWLNGVYEIGLYDDVPQWRIKRDTIRWSTGYNNSDQTGLGYAPADQGSVQPDYAVDGDPISRHVGMNSYYRNGRVYLFGGWALSGGSGGALTRDIDYFDVGQPTDRINWVCNRGGGLVVPGFGSANFGAEDGEGNYYLSLTPSAGSYGSPDRLYKWTAATQTISSTPVATKTTNPFTGGRGCYDTFREVLMFPYMGTTSPSSEMRLIQVDPVSGVVTEITPVGGTNCGKQARLIYDAAEDEYWLLHGAQHYDAAIKPNKISRIIPNANLANWVAQEFTPTGSTVVSTGDFIGSRAFFKDWGTAAGIFFVGTGGLLASSKNCAFLRIR